MKKFMVLGAAMCIAMAFTGCKSSESAYKKAYEKAKSQEQTSTDNDDSSTQQDAPVVAPVETQIQTQPVTETRTVDNYDNEPVRRENVSVVNGAGLKAYSVVVGSFGVKANAEGLQQRLKNAGYDAQVAYNAGNNMYRVVATTYDSKASAVQSRNQLRATYTDAWLLSK
ncbi:SPOR domain-containing protein [Prevotella histicola]|uniref:SPOR domain-containing protein n=1 Tax=Prevotella histicola TaxID=470565 RepID=UPI001CB07D37|nr:SPOR domain-containing protein [Prevotella histicola]MBF1400930.1 SPOR domain-containing protein [Prevotella histicola]MBF1410200.1 SPOR domain-containing protein [Prevotella histicola]MBF1417291.1 SPOR domain-containing protein [Prevotella histicola]